MTNYAGKIWSFILFELSRTRAVEILRTRRLAHLEKYNSESCRIRIAAKTVYSVEQIISKIWICMSRGPPCTTGDGRRSFPCSGVLWRPRLCSRAGQTLWRCEERSWGSPGFRPLSRQRRCRAGDDQISATWTASRRRPVRNRAKHNNC